jgi:uncharacterized protein YjiS (DUF1127 family)
MSNYFGGARHHTQRRCLSPQARHSQSNSWLRLLDQLLRWTERSRRSAAFRDLADNPHLLRDIGLTRRKAIEEADKPIWR